MTSDLSLIQQSHQPNERTRGLSVASFDHLDLSGGDTRPCSETGLGVAAFFANGFKGCGCHGLSSPCSDGCKSFDSSRSRVVMTISDGGQSGDCLSPFIKDLGSRIIAMCSPGKIAESARYPFGYPRRVMLAGISAMVDVPLLDGAIGAASNVDLAHDAAHLEVASVDHSPSHLKKEGQFTERFDRTRQVGGTGEVANRSTHARCAEALALAEDFPAIKNVNAGDVLNAPSFGGVVGRSVCGFGGDHVGYSLADSHVMTNNVRAVNRESAVYWLRAFEHTGQDGRGK